MCAPLLSSVWPFATLWTAVHELLCPWDSPGRHTGVGCHALLQGGWNSGLLVSPALQADSWPTEPPRKPSLIWGQGNFELTTISTTPSEKAMAPHSSTLAWRIPGMGEPDGLLSMGSHRVRHDWSDLAAASTTPYYPAPPPHPQLCP